MNSSHPGIRPELPDDSETITSILDRTFGLDRLTKASYRLREGSMQVSDLAFVAELDGRVIGTIQFWPVIVGRKHRALLLGPLAVLPQMQGFGTGLLLIEHGARAAERTGHDLIILVGDESYYGKADFKRIKGPVLMPGPFDPKRLLCRELKPGAANGLSGLILPPHRS